MPKNLDSDENINPILSRFTHFLEIFGPKSAFDGSKIAFLDKKCTITWYMLQITIGRTGKFAITSKNDVFVPKK